MKPIQYQRIIAALAIVASGTFQPLCAGLEPRLNGLAVYDTDRNITWSANASVGPFATHAEAVNFVSNLTVGGVTGWRLPRAVFPDNTCSNDGSGRDNIAGFNCTASEMGHLFYEELGGIAGTSILNSADPDLSLFTNIRAGGSDVYWYGTSFPGSNVYWKFVFRNGNQVAGRDSGLRVWPVHDGDVGPAACVPPPSGIVSWWTGDNDAADLKGSNEGTLRNGAKAGIAGKVGGAFELDGIDDHVDVPRSPSLNFTTELTVDAWVMPDSLTDPSNVKAIASKWNVPGVDRSWILGIFDTGQLFFMISEGTADTSGTLDYYVLSNATVPLGVFSHVAVTFDMGLVTFYANGLEETHSEFVQVWDGNIAVLPKTELPIVENHLTIGMRDQVNGPRMRFEGLLDEIRLFDRALSSAEIQQIVWAGSAGNCKSDPPVAEAGPNQSIHAGQIVQLDGTGSHDDVTPTEDLQYEWSFMSLPAGSDTELNDEAASTPSFVADLPGEYVLALTVTDSEGLSSPPDIVSVASTNVIPNADAGVDQGAVIGNTVLLDGSGSHDPDLDTLAYWWFLTDSPTGSAVSVLSPTSPIASFVPDVAGVYLFRLTVSDGYQDSEPDEVVVTAISAEEFAQQQAVNAINQLGSLDSSVFTAPGNQTALTNFVNQAVVALQIDDATEAVDKLEKALTRSDGCALQGQPDGNGPGKDWIIYCAAQESVYDLLNSALGELAP